MMMESNYSLLKYYRLSPSEREKRTQYLQDTLTQLEKYHTKAKSTKRPLIAQLIAKYDELLANLI